MLLCSLIKNLIRNWRSYKYLLNSNQMIQKVSKDKIFKESQLDKLVKEIKMKNNNKVKFLFLVRFRDKK